jgi:hypothetical protein
LALAVVLVGWRGARATIVTGSVLVVAWAVAVVVVTADYRDADGFIDCWPRCTAVQDVVSTVLWASPALLLILLGSRLAGWMTRRPKS